MVVEEDIDAVVVVIELVWYLLQDHATISLIDEMFDQKNCQIVLVLQMLELNQMCILFQLQIHQSRNHDKILEDDNDHHV